MYEEGNILNSSSGCTWPDSGVPAPCQVVLDAMNWKIFDRGQAVDPQKRTLPDPLAGTDAQSSRTPREGGEDEADGQKTEWIFDGYEQSDTHEKPVEVKGAGINYVVQSLRLVETGHFEIIGKRPRLAHFIQPQGQHDQMWVPIKDLKGLIQQRLDYGDCKGAAARLISKAAELSNGKNDAISTDIMTLYEMIDHQPKGGFRPNSKRTDVPSYLPPVSGGSGLSWGNILRGDATAMIFIKGGFSDNPASLARLPYDYGISGIHEIIHLAGKNTVYGEDLLNQAARELEQNSESNFDKYLTGHCLPAKYR